MRSNVACIAFVAVVGSCGGAIIPFLVSGTTPPEPSEDVAVQAAQETAAADEEKPQAADPPDLFQAYYDLFCSLDRIEKSCDDFLRIEPEPAWPANLRAQFNVLREVTLSVKRRVSPFRTVAVRLSRGSTSSEDRSEFKRLSTELFDELRPRCEEEHRRYMEMLAPIVAAEEERKRRAEAERRANEDLGVTWKAYSKIRTGMSYIDVYFIIGTPGQEQSSAGSLKTYAWSEGYRSIVGTFDGDRLVAKAQFGL